MSHLLRHETQGHLRGPLDIPTYKTERFTLEMFQSVLTTCVCRNRDSNMHPHLSHTKQMQYTKTTTPTQVAYLFL